MSKDLFTFILRNVLGKGAHCVLCIMGTGMAVNSSSSAPSEQVQGQFLSPISREDAGKLCLGFSPQQGRGTGQEDHFAPSSLPPTAQSQCLSIFYKSHSFSHREPLAIFKEPQAQRNLHSIPCRGRGGGGGGTEEEQSWEL